MSFVSENSYLLHSYQMVRSSSPDIQEHAVLENPFHRVIQSAIQLLGNEEPGSGNALSTYIHRVAQEIPQTEHSGKIVSLTKTYSDILIELGKDIPPSRDSEDFGTWVHDLTTRAYMFLDSRVVDSCIQVTLPESVQKHLLIDPEELSCFDYALGQVGELRMWLTSYEHIELPGLLIDWGYRPTRDMQSGDLVLYLKDGLPTHLAIYRGDGLVQSKWGNETKLAYIHKLETAPLEYGNQILVFRPPQNIENSIHIRVKAH